MQIGAQFYTVREFATNLTDFEESLKKVADIGYKIVQISGTCAYEPAWLAEKLKETGLKCVITHTNATRIAEETDAVIADHKQFDCKYIGIGAFPWGLSKMEDYTRFVTEFKKPAKKLAENGCLLMFHNHHFEFGKSDDGRVYLERMKEDFSPEELGFTLDTYWVQAGGGDPAWWLRHLAGRVPCVHLKDMMYLDGGAKMAAVYEGNMNFDAILSACEYAKAQYLLVEQDDCNGEDPFECLKKSYQNLVAHGLK